MTQWTIGWSAYRHRWRWTPRKVGHINSTHMHAHKHTHTWTHTHTHLDTWTQTHTHIDTWTQTHTHEHTHICNIICMYAICKSLAYTNNFLMFVLKGMYLCIYNSYWVSWFSLNKKCVKIWFLLYSSICIYVYELIAPTTSGFCPIEWKASVYAHRMCKQLHGLFQPQDQINFLIVGL